MARDYDAMAAGHLCFDVIPRFGHTGAARIEDILRPGKLVVMGEAAMSTGGPVSNTGIALQRLGNRVCFNARVGDDDFGRLTVEYLRGSGNAEGIRVVEGAASSYTIVIAPPGIDRVFLHNPGTNDEYCADDLRVELLRRCRVFHFGYPPLMRAMYRDEGSGLAAVLRAAKGAGATTSCDMALPDPDAEAGRAPWSKILARVLPFVDLFLPSVEESLYMLEPETFLRAKEERGGADLIDVLAPRDYSRIADRLLDMGPKVVALKSGHRGYYVKTRAGDGFGAAAPGDPQNWSGRELWCPAYAVERLASATGSGDSSIAGFLTAFLAGASIEDALKYAVCLGWQNVQTLDAVSGIRSLEETAALVAGDPPQIDARVSGRGWTWSGSQRLWHGPCDGRRR